MSNTPITPETCPILTTLDLLDNAAHASVLTLKRIHMATQAIKTHERLLALEFLCENDPNGDYEGLALGDLLVIEAAQRFGAPSDCMAEGDGGHWSCPCDECAAVVDWEMTNETGPT